MVPIRKTVCGISVGVLISLIAHGDTPNNPYLAVVERNAFGLKPPPPPPAETIPPPTVPLAKVVLTGIVTSLLGSAPRVLLEITEQDAGKTANVKRPIMRQGEREGAIEILGIDIARSQVTIRNGTIETNITFEVAKSSGPAAGLPTAPGLAPTGVLGSTLTGAGANLRGGAPGPTIISPGGSPAEGRSGTGVSVYGSTGVPTATPASYVSGASPGQTPVSTYGAGNTTRDLRADPNAGPTAQQIYQRMVTQKQAADQAGIMLPPLPPSPHLQGAGMSPPSLPPRSP